jgi:hypothetical protein
VTSDDFMDVLCKAMSVAAPFVHLLNDVRPFSPSFLPFSHIDSSFFSSQIISPPDESEDDGAASGGRRSEGEGDGEGEGEEEEEEEPEE